MRNRLGGLFLALLVVEVVLFVLMTRGIGFLPALAVAGGMSLLGVWLLGRSLRGGRIPAAIQENVAAGRPMLEGVGFELFTPASAILFAVPGFLSDVAALALFVPAVRRFLARRFFSPATRPRVEPPDDPDVIDV